MKITNENKAEILVQALPYIRKYSGQILVVKYGGSAMIDPELKKNVMKDLVLLAEIGVKVVLVHGGGPEINETLKKMNMTSKFVDGLRVTDKEHMAVVQMVLAGKVNKDLVALIENAGGKAMGMCGVDGGMMEAKPVSDALGYVGDITNVNVQPILAALEMGYIPVISSIAYDKEGNLYNINADFAAARIAGELKVSSFINMTDIKGILANPADEDSLIREVAASEAMELVRSGVITGGMIPKIKCCIEAIRRGVKNVFIIDGRVPHAILIEVLSDEGIGTMIY